MFQRRPSLFRSGHDPFSDRPATPSPVLTALALTLWMGLVHNGVTAWRRAEAVYAGATTGVAVAGTFSEAVLVGAVTLLLWLLLGSLGRWPLRLGGALMLLASATCAYYMTRFQVVIGYGVISAIFTTDHDMSGEVVGVAMITWVLLTGALPLWWLWRRTRAPLGLVAAKREGRLGTWLLAAGLTVAAGVAAKQALDWTSRHLRGSDAEARVNLSGVAAHTYVPSNWIAGTAMVAANRWSAAREDRRLPSPAQRFRYEPEAPLGDVTVLLVIGESARHDHFGLLGYRRQTTPKLATLPGIAAFPATSCDTSTKLSLACMFVRPEGQRLSDGLSPDVMLEDNVFSVFKHLGFAIELFAMQSEVGFYQRVRPDFYKIREVIAAQPENAGQPLDDMLLVPEVVASVQRHPGRPRLVVLHTKGSHYLYTARYPRAFATFGPECPGTDSLCSAEQLIASYDNSIVFTDHVLHELATRLKDRPVLMVYTSDHGESIGENLHFHATPRKIAPPEQRRVPLLLWASPAFLKDPVRRAGFERAQARAATAKDGDVGHGHLFATLLGCAGVASPDGGITAAHDLCH